MKNIVVIGSGIAGSIICNELSKSANVTLLEKGEKDVISYPKINFQGKKLAPFNTFCFSGGGGTNLWHNGLIPIGIQDVVSSSFSELLNDAEPFTNKAAEMLNFKGDYSKDYKNVVNEMNQLADSIGHFGDGMDCLIYPKKYSKLSVSNKVTEHYSVEDISFESDKGEINKVNFNKQNEKLSISVDVVIIAAGTFGSPEIVKKVLAEIELSSKDVGKGLIDHPAGFVGKVKFSKEIATSINDFASLDKGNFESCSGIRIKSNCGKYTCFAFLRPAFTMSNHLSIYQYKSLLGGSSGMERIKNALSLKLFHPDILVEVISHVFDIRVPSNTFNILVYFQQHQSKNLVNYNDQGHDINWNISDEELQIYNELLAKLDDNLTKISEKTNIQQPITKEWLRSGAHHSGTINLGGEKPSDIDINLNLNGCANVYVCDGSVIQEHSYANTGLTIGKLALRLCEKIKHLS
jgi:hypothetical protein